MTYMALYRQWRPQDFDNLIGQEHISTTLKNAVRTGKIAHAYLFSGPRGTGKTSTAKILAKALNCVQGPTPSPCNQCPNCERITAGISMDVFEIDAASNRGIDEIRDLREAVKYSPVEGRRKVYIIDEVHMLTTEAFNALLKTLEEPPDHVVFVLATTEPHKIPTTIHSRCQRYDFRRITVNEIEQRLATVAASNGLDVAGEALHLIAMHSDGSMRDALSILDQCIALGEEKISGETVRSLLGLVGHEWVWKLTDAMADRDAAGVLLILDELVSMGKDARQVLRELVLHGRSLLLYKAAPDVSCVEMYSEDQTILAAQSAKFSHDELVRLIQGLQSAANEARWSVEPRIVAEMALLAVSRREPEIDLAGLVARVAALEAVISGGGPKPEEKPRLEQQVQPKPQAVSRESDAADKIVKARTEPVIPSPAIPKTFGSDFQEVWDAFLKVLLADGKRSVYACISQGRIVGMSGAQVEIRFESAFAKERSEKEDYRTMIEKMLSQLLGRQIKILCTFGAPQTKKEELPALGSEEENHPALNQAIKMFGGKVVKEENNEEDK